MMEKFLRSFLKFKYCLKVKDEIDDWFQSRLSVRNYIY